MSISLLWMFSASCCISPLDSPLQTPSCEMIIGSRQGANNRHIFGHKIFFSMFASCSEVFFFSGEICNAGKHRVPRSLHMQALLLTLSRRGKFLTLLSRFKIKDAEIGRNHLAAWACIRLDRLRQGYRLVYLHDCTGEKSGGFLLVKITKQFS